MLKEHKFHNQKLNKNDLALIVNLTLDNRIMIIVMEYT